MRAFGLLQPVDGSNVRIVQRRQDLGLSLESGEAFFVLSIFDRQNKPLEDAVLLKQVVDDGLLVSLDPPSHGDYQERPGLDRGAHDDGF